MNYTLDSSEKDILCIILHYGNSADTWGCLDSLGNEPGIDVVVVDNDPRQNFDLPKAWAESASLLRSGGSMGFAEANNFGVIQKRQKNHSLIMFLNNDTVVRDGALQSLRRTMADPRIGMAGPTIPYWDSPGKLWAAGGKVFRLLVSIDGIRMWPASKITDVDYLPGAAFLTRSDLWLEIGGLPERYFLAFEEAEYALEVVKRGYRVVVDSDATILHKVGMSSDRQPMYYYNTVRNRIRFGQYLFGPRRGFIVGTLSGFLRSYTPERLGIWSRAVLDEIRGRPLTAKELHQIKERFRPAPEA